MRRLIFLVAPIFLITFFVTSSVYAKRVYLDITSAEARKIVFAVPWFQNSDTSSDNSQLDRKLADTLSKALIFHGIIDVLPSNSVAGSKSAAWNSMGADYGVIGRYSSSSDKITMEIRLFDAAEDKMIMGKSYNGPNTETDQMLYKFTDAVIEELTGKPGLATTQIAFVSEPEDKQGREVFITDILGRKMRQVTRHRNLIVSPRFSPDGNLLAYTSYHSGNQNLYVTDLRQSKTTRALSRRKGMNLAPTWSPSGNSLIVTLSHKGNPDLYQINRRGEIIKQLTTNSGIRMCFPWLPIACVSDATFPCRCWTN